MLLLDNAITLRCYYLTMLLLNDVLTGRFYYLTMLLLNDAITLRCYYLTMRSCSCIGSFSTKLPLINILSIIILLWLLLNLFVAAVTAAAIESSCLQTSTEVSESWSLLQQQRPWKFVGMTWNGFVPPNPGLFWSVLGISSLLLPPKTSQHPQWLKSPLQIHSNWFWWKWQQHPTTSNLRSRTPELETSPWPAEPQSFAGASCSGTTEWIRLERPTLLDPIPWVWTWYCVKAANICQYIWGVESGNYEISRNSPQKGFPGHFFKQTFWDRTNDLCPWR